MNEDPIRQLWQSQQGEPIHMNLDDLRRKALSFEKQIRRRNWGEYAASALVATACIAMLVLPTPMYIRAGALLLLAGVTTVCLWIYRKGSAAPAAELASVSREWYRHELERQRDLLRGVWKWYLGPLIPGITTWFAGTIYQHPERAGRTLLSALLCLAVFIAIARLNAAGARKLDREIASL